MAKIEGAFEQIDRRLGRLETEILQIREEMREMRGELVGLYKEIRNLYRMVISVLIPMWVTIIGAIIGIALTR